MSYQTYYFIATTTHAESGVTKETRTAMKVSAKTPQAAYSMAAGEAVKYLGTSTLSVEVKPCMFSEVK